MLHSLKQDAGSCTEVGERVVRRDFATKILPVLIEDEHQCRTLWSSVSYPTAAPMLVRSRSTHLGRGLSDRKTLSAFNHESLDLGLWLFSQIL